MPVGQTRFQVLATESQYLRPTPLAYTFSSKGNLLFDVQEVEPEMLNGDDKIGWWGSLVFDDPCEAFADQILDRLVRAGSAASECYTVLERGTCGNKAAWVT
jgi:hypothetical protein